MGLIAAAESHQVSLTEKERYSRKVTGVIALIVIEGLYKEREEGKQRSGGSTQSWGTNVRFPIVAEKATVFEAEAFTE